MVTSENWVPREPVTEPRLEDGSKRTSGRADERPRTPSGSTQDRGDDDTLQEGADLGTGAAWVGGQGDVEGGLVEGADEHVGQGRDGLLGDVAGRHRLGEQCRDEAEAVTQPDLAPALPPE